MQYTRGGVQMFVAALPGYQDLDPRTISSKLIISNNKAVLFGLLWQHNEHSVMRNICKNIKGMSFGFGK